MVFLVLRSREHNKYLELIYPNNVKNKKWMREKHNATFPDWLKEKVSEIIYYVMVQVLFYKN